MIALNSTSRGVVPASLLSPSQASARFGICIATLRRWDSEGRLTAYRTNGRGHRRFSPEDIERCMGVDIQQTNDERIPVVYARTSSLSQKDSLRRQIDRMKGEVSQRENIPLESVKIYSDNSSAYGDRPALNKLIEDVISGQISRIYILWECRLSRSPCLTRMVESICHNRGVDIITIEPECTDEDELQIAFTEALHLINIVVNKKNGRRGGQKVKVSMDDSTLQRIYELYKSGLSVRQIESQLREEGIVDDKGRAYKRGVIGKRLAENYSTMQKVYDEEPTNSFREFCQLFVRKATPNKTIKRKSIISAYEVWAKKQKKMVVGQATITKTIDSLYGVGKSYDRHRVVTYTGLVLNTGKGGGQ